MCQHHLENGHEGRGLTEVAAADYVGVNVDALCVGPRLDAPHHVVESTYNGWGQLERAGEQSGGENSSLLKRLYYPSILAENSHDVTVI